MKCVILAGGKGERLWPLSRQDFPKQFIQIQKNHSIFQETVARNMPFCDEFIIVTNYNYRFIVANQMQAFQGVAYKCIFEETPRHTTAAITLACMELQPSEYIFVSSASHLIDTGACQGISYKDAILNAREHAKNGEIVLFGRTGNTISKRYGYYNIEDNLFVEKPDAKTIELLKDKVVYQNLGMLLFQNGTYLNEVKSLRRDIFDECKRAHENKINLSEGILYSSKALSGIDAVSIEQSIIEPTEKKVIIKADFIWEDISRLEDLEKTAILSGGVSVVNEGKDNLVINRTNDKAVVINGLDDVIAVNTADAIYIGRKGLSYKLKDIIHEHKALDIYAGRSSIVYRSWGFYEDVAVGARYRVRKATVLPGRTIYEHTHEHRCENWTIIHGTALIKIENLVEHYHAGEAVSAAPGKSHQISNVGIDNLVFIETSTGDIINDSDMNAVISEDVTEMSLGMVLDPVVKLSPAYKDYLWGGTKLRDVYNKQCDYETIAESWELSAHPAGTSIIASGRHKGLPFNRYLEVIGKEVLGWKCAHFQTFPILIKFIDAKQNLSVQVHPDDDYAMIHENEYGKNEMWYVIDSEPDAGLYVGFNREVTREEVSKRIEENTIMDVLNFYPTNPGDVFFIPAGTVHAIGKGNLICEIQQSSNCTYRLYDYDRRDKFGNPRELHLEKALEVLDYGKYQPVKVGRMGTAEEKKVRCKYFETSIQDIVGTKQIIIEEDSFHSIVCLQGSGLVKLKDETVSIMAGESLFIPAINDTLVIEGKLLLVITKI